MAANKLFQLPIGDNDTDIQAWLDNLPVGEKSQAVKTAIRQSMARDDTLVRVLKEVLSMRKDIEALQKQVKRK